MSAPFDFSNRNSLAARLLPSVINQRLGQRGAEEAARRKQAEDNFKLALRLTTEKELNPSKISPFLNLDRSQEEFLGELFRVQQQQKKIAESGQQLRGLSALPQQTPQVTEATRGVFGELEQLGPSAAERGMAQRRAGGIEREEFLQKRQLGIQKEQQLAIESFARQRTKEDENRSISNLADQIAFEIIGEAPVTATQDRVSGLIAQGHSPGRAIELHDAAQAISEGKASALRLKIRSTEGLTKEEIRARDKVSFWKEKFGIDFITEGQGFTEEQLKRNARMEVSGDLQSHPYFSDVLGELVFVETTGSVDQKNFRESADAQIQLMHMRDTMVANFRAMRKAKADGDLGIIGPFFGSWYVKLLTTAGQLPRAAAAYQVSMFAFISFMLKAIQGARPSDFDLRMFLAQAPSFTEVMSGSADAKIENLEMQTRIGLAARLDKERAAEIIRKIKIPESKEDKDLFGVWDKFNTNKGGREWTSLTFDEQQEAYGELQDAMDRWISSGRPAFFTMQGVGDGANLRTLSIDEENAVRKALRQPPLPPVPVLPSQGQSLLPGLSQ